MAFAITDDIAKRLGRASLTSQETEQADLLLEIATGLVAAAADKDDAWAATLSPVPAILKGFVIELTVRGMANPSGLASLSETLGQYASTQRFREAAGGGMTLTELEERVIRRVVYGTTTGSVRVESVTADLFPCYGS